MTTRKTAAPNQAAALMGRNAARAGQLLKELAHAGRLQILCSLVESPRTVGDLIAMVDMPQSAVSQHLMRLRDAGLVEAERRGRHIHYRLRSAEARALISTLHLIYCGT